MSFDPYSQQTTRVEEIKDCFGRTRFKVTLTDFDNPEYPLHDDLTAWDTTFQVTVVSYCVSDTTEPIILVDEQFDELSDATAFFFKKTQEYKTLVAAETKGWQDITNFNDQIHYKTIDPDCCKNCKWAKPITKDNCLFNDYKKHKARFYCTNPAIAKVQKEIDPEDPRTTQEPYHNDGERVTVQFDLAPVVQEDGICDDYSRNLSYLYMPQVNGTACSQAHFDCHKTATPEQIRDSQMQYEINSRMDQKLNNIKISKIIGNDNDANQNDIDDSEEATIVGNLGA